MIEGYINSSTLSPMVPISLVGPDNEEIELNAIIDTGYNGEIILPESKILEMGLEFLGTIDSELADGQIVATELFAGRVKWFDTIQEISIGASQSNDVLLGTLLLVDCELNIDFKRGEVNIKQL